MKLKSKYLLIISLALILITSACQDNRVYESYVDIPNHEWNKDYTARFEVEITDSIQLHNIYVNIRNTGKYPYSNLWLFIKQIDPEGKMTEEKYECQLASDTGEWYGSGFGNIFDLQMLYKPAILFTKPGLYTFEMVQGMRDDKLLGVVNIGLKLDKTNQ
ncbi:gliding motility lipoprotein GldH [Ancylomarina euxinus]|uniref:Gliding motility lipoprotein GldH n=1 Tax=Ancylomarina euxinus TaxID=2283627 RepID=A0A425XZU0_9BACT|nr:gliding motility lipoprotein GldH [Ancylomarina euxinus]MCZ4695478.1 gliding motility lipoprotein GldH [Ancylomarina euxinus]MUP15704.1 gliding motility lipoprotein GldH [Ancylomarina euxinus]RRG20696.1 gliding motility lipoprotein GldH [Ancylomarina euxinus]